MTIDLDVAPAARTRAGGRRTRFDVLVVAVLVLVLAGASTPLPYAGGLTPVLEGDGRSVTASLLTGLALYTQHGTTVDHTADIWARPVDPGGPEWITQVPGSGLGLWLDVSGTVLVSEAGDAGVTTFLDARTGRVRWRAGEYATVRPLGAAVTDWAPGRLRVRDVTTGQVLWWRPAEAFVADEARRLVVTFDEGRRATVVAAGDGRVLAGPRDLGVEWGVDHPAPLAPGRVIGDRLVVFGTTFVTAFRLADLAPLWRTATARPFHVTGCGGRICAFADGGLTVLDPVTGGVLWTAERWRGLAGDGETLLDATGGAARVDLATGRVRADLGVGTLVGGLQLVDGHDRTLVRRVADGRTLGSVSPVVPEACTASADLLACRTVDARLRVWRVRAA